VIIPLGAAAGTRNDEGSILATRNRALVIAFDEWKTAELARLEEERRRLDEAQREFAEYVEAIRRAKDREDFERFMTERRARQTGGAEPR